MGGFFFIHFGERLKTLLIRGVKPKRYEPYLAYGE